jgi:hypothetical protein
MKCHPWILPAAIAFALLPLAGTVRADDEKPPEDKSSLQFDMGAQGSSPDGSTIRAAEYDLIEPNPIFGLRYANSPYRSSRVVLDLYRLNTTRQSGVVSWDANRVFRADASLYAMIHRLDHDPLTNMQGVSDIKVVRRTDFDPGTDYQIRYQTARADMILKPPSAGWLTVRVGAEQRKRDGMKQAIAQSHCTSCHVTSRGRDVEESTRDLTASLHGRFGRWDVDYRILDRQFRERGETPTAPYEKAYHPGQLGGTPPALQTPFNDRIWFQDTELPAYAIPDVEKTSHTFRVRGGFREADSLTLAAVVSKDENTTTTIERDFTGYRGKYNLRLGKVADLHLWGRLDEYESDPVAVDLLALNGLTSAPTSSYPGPVPGTYTYQDWVRLKDGRTDFDWENYVRASAYERTDTRLGADAVWRPIRGGSLRGGYEYRSIDRDNVPLADGTGKTTLHTLKASWNHRIQRSLRWDTSLLVRTADNAYVSVDGGCQAYDPNRVGVAASPKAPGSVQYYELHERRYADLTNVPSLLWSVRSSATWAPKGIWALNGTVRYRDAENDDLDYSTWAEDSLGLGVNFWILASPKVQFMIGYDLAREDTTAHLCVPLMDG